MVPRIRSTKFTGGCNTWSIIPLNNWQVSGVISYKPVISYKWRIWRGQPGCITGHIPRVPPCPGSNGGRSGRPYPPAGRACCGCWPAVEYIWMDGCKHACTYIHVYVDTYVCMLHANSCTYLQEKVYVFDLYNIYIYNYNYITIII